MNLESRAEQLLDKLVAQFPLGYRPTIVWQNLRVTAGRAHYHDQAISLSSIVIDDEMKLKDTLIHEYAHLLAFVRHGRKGVNHGPLWQEAMRDLGAVPKVRHKYDVQRNERRQQVVYVCQKCKVEILRPKRFPTRRRYHHVNCGGLIRFVRIEMVKNDAPES